MTATPSRLITEAEFGRALRATLGMRGITAGVVRSVTGPGRSGAIAAVYASHWLGVPYIPCDALAPAHLHPVLVIDTATQTGRTLRRAERHHGPDAIAVAVYSEPPRVRFWYEAGGQRVAASVQARAPVSLIDRMKVAARRLLMWRTVMLLEQVDADVDRLRQHRDIEVPKLRARLSADKSRLLQQLQAMEKANQLTLSRPTPAKPPKLEASVVLFGRPGAESMRLAVAAREPAQPTTLEPGARA